MNVEFVLYFVLVMGISAGVFTSLVILLLLSKDDYRYFKQAMIAAFGDKK